MNKMREAFKKITEENTLSIENHLGELINQSWEVVRVSSRVIDQCLNTEFVAESEKIFF